MNFRFSINAYLLATILGIFSFSSTDVNAQNTENFEITKNLDIFINLYKELHTNYVDEVNASKLMKDGIDGMLKELDPYTVYIPETEIEDYRFMTTGEYGGIGSLIHKQDDKIVISEPYENSPAQKSGLKAGDRILKVNGKSTSDKTVDDVSTALKGQPGTTVSLVIERNGESKPLNFDILREKIHIDPVPYYGMLKNNTGYIKLTSFTQTSYADVKKAFLDLKEKNVMNSLVIDLRDNGGGLLTEAVNIVNLFVNKGEVIVSTKGKQFDKNKTYQTMFEPADTQIPLIVLVNGSSASASEIVSGALQDLDRAVIVGRRTFGKGLVQNIYPLSYNTQAKITVAKYYIPSGRCIQEIDYSHKNLNGNSDHIPDSLISAYKTKNGRTVFDGKGILPDVISDSLSFSTLAVSLINKYIIFDYATQYYHNNPNIADAASFRLSNAEYDKFVEFARDKKLEYVTVLERELADLKKTSEKEGTWEAIKPSFEALEKTISDRKQLDFITYKSEISLLLESEIVSRYYYQKGRIIYSLSTDPDINKALELFDQPGKIKSILN